MSKPKAKKATGLKRDVRAEALMLSRREFLRNLLVGAGAVAVAAALPSTGALRGWEDLPEEVEPPTVEDQVVPRWTRLVGDQDEEGTSLVVDDSACFHANDALLVPRTGEILRVLQVKAHGNVLTVGRATAGTSAAKMLDLDWVLRLRPTG